MKVNEIFQSIQGEGLTSGKAVTFVRMQGCNLHCSFCDTKYAIPTEGVLDGYGGYTVQELSGALNELPLHGNTIVWTGGEPLLQEDGIVATIHRLPAFYLHELETNGTIIPERPGIFNLITVSPKGDIDYRAWKSIARDEGNVQFKFVVDDLADAYPTILEWNLPRETVWIMPKTRPEVNTLEAHKRIAEECVGAGLNFSPRLQALFEWGKAQ